MKQGDGYAPRPALRGRMGGGEKRTRTVVSLTLGMMAVEVVVGLWSGSMALLADGMHMASHAVALGIAAYAYWYGRRHVFDPRFAFGTGKVNALGGFTGAVFLAVFSLLMAVGSVGRMIEPVQIAFGQAIAVAIVGLLVNGVSALILGHGEQEHGHEHDHNLRSAYLHVLADAVTSLAAIVALLAAKYTGWLWVDPFVGIAGSLLVGRWALGLLRSSSEVLLDRQAGERVWTDVHQTLCATPGVKVEELLVWSIGPGISAVSALVIDDNHEGATKIASTLDPEAFPYVVIHLLSGQ